MTGDYGFEQAVRTGTAAVMTFAVVLVVHASGCRRGPQTSADQAALTGL